MTIHPHGIFYAHEMDGAYKGKYTDPGGFVQRNRTFTYVWEAQRRDRGAWLYHDHGPMDPLPVYKGLFGPLIIREPGEAAPRPRVLPRLPLLHAGGDRPRRAPSPASTATPTPATRRRCEAKVGERVAFHVFAIDNDFHTFHIHGHRWTDADRQRSIDNKTLGPGDSFTARVHRGQPGPLVLPLPRVQPPAQGMNGWYIVS